MQRDRHARGADGEAVSDDTAWLITNTIAGRDVWWRAHNECGRTWTTDANDAVRFARKEDAERVIGALRGVDGFMPDATATEHMWCPPP